jgi:C1A family cysteine protease
MALAVIFQNPVDLGFVVTPSWDHNNQGWVSYVPGESNRGGHDVTVVGFISNQQLAAILPSATPAPTNGYFIVKNSWANCWGDGGFAYVPWDYVAAYANEATIVHAVQ